MVDEDVGQAIINSIISKLKKFGPALVFGFIVTENFLEAKIHKHLGQDNSTEGGLHVAKLVECFIEVDAGYLAGQRASLVFVQSEQPNIPAQFLGIRPATSNWK